jgi:hypothetical protein
VDEATFLREARWVVEAWNLSLLEKHQTLPKKRLFFYKAHRERLHHEHAFQPMPELARTLPELLDRHQELNNQGKVHLLLAAVPLAKIETVYRSVFENILGEKVSTNPVQIDPGGVCSLPSFARP